MAGEDNVLLKTGRGRESVLAELDDLSKEVELARQNTELMALLAHRSGERATVTLGEARKYLGLA